MATPSKTPFKNKAASRISIILSDFSSLLWVELFVVLCWNKGLQFVHSLNSVDNCIWCLIELSLRLYIRFYSWSGSLDWFTFSSLDKENQDLKKTVETHFFFTVCIVLIIHTSTTCSKNCRVPISLGNIGSSSKWYFYSSCSNMTFAIVITDLEVGIMFSLKKNGIQYKKCNLGKLQTMHKQLKLNSF